MNFGDLFGAGTLKKAAGDNGDKNYVPATVTDAQRNQAYADKQLGKAAPVKTATPTPAASPLATPMGSTAKQTKGKQ